jgi:hypothetical protein
MKMDRCLICNRKLKDKVSIQRKIGPTCFNRLKKVKQMYKRKRPEKVKGQISLFDKEG